MANVIHCPRCDRQLRVPDELIGESVKCPNCDETFTAAAASNGPAAGLSDRPSSRPRDDEPAPSRRPPRRRDDDYDDDDDRVSRRRRLAPHRGDMIQLLGILSFFIAGIILGPMAWVMGNNDLREMDAGRMDPAGRSATSTGRVCGMISTILHIGGLAVGVLFMLVYFGACCCLAGGAGLSGGGGGGPPPGRKY
jgi:predicted Zn finger-like uncharacterized protein